MFNPALKSLANVWKTAKVHVPKGRRAAAAFGPQSPHTIRRIISYLKCRSEARMQWGTRARARVDVPVSHVAVQFSRTADYEERWSHFPSSCHCWGLCTLDSHLTPAHYCKVKPNQACMHALILYVWARWRFTSEHRPPYSIFVFGQAHCESVGSAQPCSCARPLVWLFYL